MNMCVVCFVCDDELQLQSSWQQLQSSQANVSAEMQCLTEEMSVMQVDRDKVPFIFAMLSIHLNYFNLFATIYILSGK